MNHHPANNVKSKGDYLKGILGSINSEKHFCYLKFVTRFGKFYVVGKKEKRIGHRSRIFSLGIAVEWRK